MDGVHVTMHILCVYIFHTSYPCWTQTNRNEMIDKQNKRLVTLFQNYKALFDKAQVFCMCRFMMHIDINKRARTPVAPFTNMVQLQSQHG